MGWLDDKVEPKSRGFQGRLLPRCVTIAEVLDEAGYFTAMTGKWHLGQQNGTPPWKRGFMRSLNSQFGEVYFPKETRPAGHRDALSQRPQDPQGLAGAGQGLVLDRIVHRLGPEIHRRGPRGEKAVLPLHCPRRGPFSPAGAGRRDRPLSRQVHGRLGQAARSPPRPANRDGHRRPALAALAAAGRIAGLGHPRAGPQGPLRRDHGGLCGDDRVHRPQRRQAGRRTEGTRRAGQHADRFPQRQRRQRGGRAGGRDQGQGAHRRPAVLRHAGHELGHAGQYALPPLQAFHARRRNQLAVHRPLAGRHSRATATAAWRSSRGTSSTSWPPPSTWPGRNIRRSSTATPSCRWRASACGPRYRASRWIANDPSSGSTRATRPFADGKWKLVQKWRGPWELYDMEADRTELHNVIAEHPDVAARLQAAWKDWEQRAYVDPWPGPDHTNWGDDISEEVVARRLPHFLARRATPCRI